jgi:hypothetical protein
LPDFKHGGENSMSTPDASPQHDRRTEFVSPAHNASDGKPGQTTVHHAEKPKPIITGYSQAQGIAKFASRVTYADLTPERRERLKVSVLDSLGCAINALGAPPILACLQQAREFGGSDASVGFFIPA